MRLGSATGEGSSSLYHRAGIQQFQRPSSLCGHRANRACVVAIDAPSAAWVHRATRQQGEYYREPSIQVHCAESGSIRLGSLFLTLPTRVLTGQQVISSDG